MPNMLYKEGTDKDMIGLNVYYKDSKDKLCQYFVTSSIMDLELAVADCQGQVIEAVTDFKSDSAVLALIIGGKVWASETT